jgi:hypothetical protein
MRDLLRWCLKWKASSAGSELPEPIVAGGLHYKAHGGCLDFVASGGRLDMRAKGGRLDYRAKARS